MKLKHQKIWTQITKVLLFIMIITPVFSGCKTFLEKEIIILPNGLVIKNPRIENFGEYNLILTERGYKGRISILEILDSNLIFKTRYKKSVINDSDNLESFYSEKDEIDKVIFHSNKSLSILKNEITLILKDSIKLDFELDQIIQANDTSILFKKNELTFMKIESRVERKKNKITCFRVEK